MQHREQEYVTSLMNCIRNVRTINFSGIGVIFYATLSNLQTIPLGRKLHAEPVLPIRDFTGITRTLVSSADLNSHWHDGFHLVDIKRNELTHLSHFIAPPLEAAHSIPLEQLPSGARNMTALLASLVPGIVCVCLVDVDGNIILYESGYLAEPS